MPNGAAGEATDAHVLRISPEDNVAVAVRTIEPGQTLEIGGRSVTITQRIPTGHKLALMPIAAGQKVIKYGLPIGSATAEIRPGQYVHTHNVRSDYLPTYTRDDPLGSQRNDHV